MKAVILAGGFGTRLSEETLVRPKPMIEIGGKPILWVDQSKLSNKFLTDKTCHYTIFKNRPLSA